VPEEPSAAVGDIERRGDADRMRVQQIRDADRLERRQRRGIEGNRRSCASATTADSDAAGPNDDEPPVAVPDLAAGVLLPCYERQRSLRLAGPARRALDLLDRVDRLLRLLERVERLPEPLAGVRQSLVEPVDPLLRFGRVTEAEHRAAAVRHSSHTTRSSTETILPPATFCDGTMP
jgi:hypothetical protein